MLSPVWWYFMVCICMCKFMWHHHEKLSLRIFIISLKQWKVFKDLVKCCDCVKNSVQITSPCAQAYVSVQLFTPFIKGFLKLWQMTLSDRWYHSLSQFYLAALLLRSLEIVKIDPYIALWLCFHEKMTIKKAVRRWRFEFIACTRVTFENLNEKYMWKCYNLILNWTWTIDFHWSWWMSSLGGRTKYTFTNISLYVSLSN